MVTKVDGKWRMDNSKEGLEKGKRRNITKRNIESYHYMSLEIMQKVIYFKMAGKYKVLLPSEKLLDEMYSKRSYEKQSNAVAVPPLTMSSLSVTRSKRQLRTS